VIVNISLLVKDTLWNVFLAVIPVVLAYAVVQATRLQIRRAIRIPLSLALSLMWLAFLPNTCYLLTEWRHFFEVMNTYNLYWRASYDKLALMQLSAMWLYYFLYSSVGMLCFTMALRPIEHYWMKRGAPSWIWTAPLNIALALGVYLGLVLRFNSWDLATRPGAVWLAIREVGQRPRLALFICAFGLFLWISYKAIDIWVDGLKYRLKKIDK